MDCMYGIKECCNFFQITVLRSPDGVSVSPLAFLAIAYRRCLAHIRHWGFYSFQASWVVGSLSIQRAAVWVLQRYYAEFPAYNPHLERLPLLRKRHPSSAISSAPSFKFYDFDSSTFAPTSGSRLSRRAASHNERFYEEHEYDRRVRKRRARLVAATEEAFTHIRRLQDEQGIPTRALLYTLT